VEFLPDGGHAEKLFRQPGPPLSTGLSPHRYLLAHRIDRAKEMMNDHERSLTQIALDCGFSGSSQFSVVFKRIVGVSPRQYRRSL